MHKINYHVFENTHVGLVRKINEDHVLSLHDYNTFVVCDGMGGHAAGEIASEIGIQTFKLVFENEENIILAESLLPQENQLLLSCVLANKFIFNTAETNPGKKGMGTTLISAQINENGLFWASIGDSRLYRINTKSGIIEQISVDHSLLNEMLRLGEISEKEAETFTQKNIITRSVGTSEVVSVDYGRTNINADDYYLLCSDGLSDYVLETEIYNSFLQNELESIGDKLIKLALEAGAPDNTSIIIICISNNENRNKELNRETLSRKDISGFSTELNTIFAKYKFGQDGFSVRSLISRASVPIEHSIKTNKKYYLLSLCTLLFISLLFILQKPQSVNLEEVNKNYVVTQKVQIEENDLNKYEIFFVSLLGNTELTDITVFLNDSLVGVASEFENDGLKISDVELGSEIKLYKKLVNEPIFIGSVKASNFNKKGKEYIDIDEI